MKISNPNTNREPTPNYTGKASVADVSPLRKQQTQYGEREVFNIVLELNLHREDGTPYYVWSKPLTPTLNDKSNLRKFVRGLIGRDLTKAELNDFDTESLIGLPAIVVVVQEHKDGKTYANLVACSADKSGEPLKPSGKYVRIKDRPPKDGNGYRRAEQAGDGSADLLATKIHVGKCQGMEVRDLAPEQVQALVTNWLPAAKANVKPTADDKRLIVALEQWQAAQPVTEVDVDNIPY